MGGIDLGAVKARIEGDASGLEDSVARATKILDGFSSAAVGAGAAIGVGFKAVEAAVNVVGEFSDAVLNAGVSLAKAVADVADFSEHLMNLSTVTGLSVDALQAMGKAAVEAGGNADTFVKAVTRMETQLGSGTKQVQEAVSALGLSWKDLTEQSPDEAFNKVAQSLMNMTDVAERNAAAQKLFGRGFQEVLPAMQAYLEAGDRFVNLSNEQIAAGLEMDHSLDELKTAWTELWQQIGATLNTPEVRQGIADLAQAIRNITIAVKDGSGPVASFFKAIAEHANNAAKWVVFLGGAMDGLKERLSSLSKEDGGIVAGGLKALDAFEAKVNAEKNKEWGASMFPSLFSPEQGKLGNLGDAQAEAAAKANAKLIEKTNREAAADLEKFSRQYNKAMVDMVSMKPDTMADVEKQLNGMMGPVDEFNKNTRFMTEETAKFQVAQAEWVTQHYGDQYDLQEQRVQDHFKKIIDAEKQQRDEMFLKGEDTSGIDALIAHWKDLEQAELDAIEQARKYAEIQEVLGLVGQSLQQLQGIFQQLGISADSFVGKLVSGLGQAAQAAQGAVSGFQAMQAGIAKGGITGILGAVSGGLSLVSGAIGVVKGIVGIFSKPEYKKIMGDVGKSWGVSISEALAKEIEGIEKKFHISKGLAELLDTSKIIQESGKDPREFTSKINDLMNAIAAGSVPAAEGLAELGRSFNMVADAALKSGNIGDKSLVTLLKRARELGEVTPEMKEFVAGQLDSAVDGINKLIEALPANTDLSAAGAGALTAATFNAVAAEKGIVAATEALGPSYDKLMKQISDAGLAIPASLSAIGRQIELGRNKEFAAASSGAAATSQVLAGLGNAGYMDASVLGGAGDIAKQTFDQAKAAGATDKEAYQAIGGLLSDINNASRQSGIALTGIEQELINGAAANGVKVQEDQLSVLVDIRNILGGGGGAYGGGTATAGGGGGSAYGGGAGASPDYSGGYPEYDTGGYTPRGAGRYGYAGGSYGIKDFGAGTPVTLHGREAVVTEKDYNRMTAGGGGLTVNATFTGSRGQTYEDQKQLTQFQLNQLVMALRNDPVIIKFIREPVR